LNSILFQVGRFLLKKKYLNFTSLVF